MTATRATYGRFTLDYVERTGPVERVGLVLTDPGHVDTGDEATCEEIAAAAKALAGREDEPIDWTANLDRVEMIFDRHTTTP
jgi:hypothetical protein